MPRALNHDLAIMPPGDVGQFAQRLQFSELRFVVGIIDRSGTQAITKTEGHVVAFHNFADVLELRVEETLAMMGQTPLGHDRTASRDDAGHAFGGHRDERKTYTRVDGEIINTLLGLFDESVTKNFPVQFLGLAIDFFERLIDWHGADRDRRIADDPFPRFVNMLAR